MTKISGNRVGNVRKELSTGCRFGPALAPRQHPTRRRLPRHPVMTHHWASPDDLVATDLYGAVADATEGTVGAYVHWNLDNDDASDNALGAPKRSGADYLQTGVAKVTGENDLKALAMQLQPDLNQGSVVLTIANARAKIWKDAEKGARLNTLSLPPIADGSQRPTPTSASPPRVRSPT